MNTRLHIGITQWQPGWEILLEQIGVDWSVLPAGEVPSPEQYSVVIATGSVASHGRKALHTYADTGGALIDNTMTGLPRPVRTLYPDPGSDTLFGHIPLVDVFGMARAYRHALLDSTVSIKEQGKGVVALLGIDIGKAVADTRRKRKLFDAPSGLFPNEVVALVSKGALRMAVQALLRELHLRRGVPFARKRFFPGTAPNIFCFRIDSDGASRQQVRTWCDIASRHAIPMSWYLHLERHRDWLDVLRDYPEQELGIHSVVHKTYTTFEENSRNIQQARSILDAEGISYTGYAAPYGTWNTGVAMAEEHHGFAYASEFSLSYDDVPFFPWVDTRFSPVLQVPIHPICLGSLGRVGMTEEQMNDYNRFVMQSKLCDGEPLVLYDHPLHPYTDALDAMFGYVDTLGIPAMSFAEYAAWWKRRAHARFSVRWANGAVVAEPGNAQEDVLLDVWYPHSAHAAMQPDGSFLQIPPLPLHNNNSPAQRNIRDVRRFSKAILRQTAIDTINKWRIQ